MNLNSPNSVCLFNINNIASNCRCVVTIDPNQMYLEAPIDRPSVPSSYVGFKRALDLILVAILTIPVTCIILIVALWMILTGVRSVFYQQQRLGKDGRVFRMWKLRSMVPDAKLKLEVYLSENPDARKEWDITQKLKNDPRITRIGRFIRKTSIDELPQLWNVLRGEMSLVGPRPMMVEQRDLYPGQEYFWMLPGITGFWQITKRNESSFAERAQFDAQYYHEMSLSTDLQVLFKTVFVLLSPTGL